MVDGVAACIAHRLNRMVLRLLPLLPAHPCSHCLTGTVFGIVWGIAIAVTLLSAVGHVENDLFAANFGFIAFNVGYEVFGRLMGIFNGVAEKTLPIIEDSVEIIGRDDFFGNELVFFLMRSILVTNLISSETSAKS